MDARLLEPGAGRCRIFIKMCFVARRVCGSFSLTRCGTKRACKGSVWLVPVGGAEMRRLMEDGLESVERRFWAFGSRAWHRRSTP